MGELTHWTWHHANDTATVALELDGVRLCVEVGNASRLATPENYREWANLVIKWLQEKGYEWEEGGR